MLNSILPCNWEIFISPGNGCDEEGGGEGEGELEEEEARAVQR